MAAYIIVVDAISNFNCVGCVVEIVRAMSGVVTMHFFRLKSYQIVAVNL
jgi:hypothetical protein